MYLFSINSNTCPTGPGTGQAVSGTCASGSGHGGVGGESQSQCLGGSSYGISSTTNLVFNSTISLSV